MYNFEKLTVGQKTMDFCELVYQESRQFPKDEIFGLTSQFRRAATSILLNISEGSACRTKREFSYFLNETSYTRLNDSSNEISKMLHGLSNSLNKSGHSCPN